MENESQAPLDAGVRPAQALIQNLNQNVQLQRPDVDQPQVQPAQSIAAAPVISVVRRAWTFPLPFLPLEFVHVSLCKILFLEKFVVRAVSRKMSVLRRAWTFPLPSLPLEVVHASLYNVILLEEFCCARCAP